MRTLKARLRISSYSTTTKGASGDGSGVRIYVIDESSGCAVIEIDISHEQFGKAVTGRGDCECTMELTPENAGKKHEHKTEAVAWKWSGHRNRDDDPTKDAALAPFEVDGWRGSRSDLGNHHRQLRDGTYNVTFHRYVDTE